MTRPNNRLSTSPIRVAGNPKLDERLNQVIDTGLFGKSRAEAAERLIAHALLSLSEQGVISRGSEEDK